MSSHEQQGTLSTYSYQQAEGLKDALPTLRSFMEETCGMPSDAIVRTVYVATKSEGAVSSYKVEVTFGG